VVQGPTACSSHGSRAWPSANRASQIAAAVPPDVFRRCLEQVAADDAVDAILVLTVPTAIADLASVACSAEVAKPLVLSVPEQAETIRLLPGPPAGPGPVPACAYPASAARALAHACRYDAWRARKPGRVPEFGDLRGADPYLRRLN